MVNPLKRLICLAKSHEQSELQEKIIDGEPFSIFHCPRCEAIDKWAYRKSDKRLRVHLKTGRKQNGLLFANKFGSWIKWIDSDKVKEKYPYFPDDIRIGDKAITEKGEVVKIEDMVYDGYGRINGISGRTATGTHYTWLGSGFIDRYVKEKAAIQTKIPEVLGI